jgi:PAS domain S-box-containing protein
MHRPPSAAESTPPAQLWLRAHGWRALALAALYFVFGHASFLVQVDDVLVTPVLFVPEGIALAMVLRFGAALWPGVFAGQLVLALSRGLAPGPSAAIAVINSLEAVLAVWLFRRLKLDAGLPRARDLTGLLLLIFFILQPFSATLGNATLWAAGIIADPGQLTSSWTNWWIGNALGQMLVAPLLLTLFAGVRDKRQAVGDFLVPLLVLGPALLVAQYLVEHTGLSSLIVIFAPLLILLAIYRGMVAVCVGGLVVALGTLYATSHAFGPFVAAGVANIPDLNLFIIGLALSGQFFATFLRQLGNQRKLEDELRASREKLQRAAYELTENIPVGTYVLEFDAKGEPHFTFLSERFLAMTGLEREQVMANHDLALQPMNAPARAEIEHINREVFAKRKRFFWEGEITVRGMVRHVTLESVPRDRPGGGTVWEGVLTDITERKRAEEQQRLIFDNLPIAVAATTLTTPAKMTFINEQFTRTFGYTLDDVPTVAAWAEKAYPDPAYRHAVFREWDTAAFRAIATRGSVESMEFEVTCKDGTKRDIIFRAVVLEERLLVSMTDVTERKKAEAALRSLREELERTAFELTENIPVGTYTMVQPPHGGMAYFSFMSTRFLELTGMEAEEARANPMNAFACVHPDDHEEWVRKNAHVFEHKLPFKEECRVVIKGETRWITAESAPRDMPDGSVVWEGVLTDITDRKLAEQRVAVSEARLRKILDNIPIPVAINDAIKDGQITFLNEAFTRTFGYTLEDVPDVGAWARLAYPDEAYRKATFQTWDAAVAEAARTNGAVAPMEFRVHAKDGTFREVIINAVALEDMLLVGFVDITARKNAEHLLSEANRNMQLAASAANLGFWETEPNTELDVWDEEMARIHGIALEDFNGHWEQFVHPEDLAKVTEENRRIIEHEKVFDTEYRIVRPSGEVRHIREHGLVTRDAAGRALRVNGVLYDVTDEKEAAKELQQSTQRMQLAAAAAGIGFWSRDLASHLEQWDDQMLAIYGVTHEEFDGRWEPFVYPDDLEQVQESTKQAMQRGVPGRYEYRIIRPDGTVRHLRGMSVAIRDTHGAPVREIGVNFDITEEKETAAREKQLEAQHRRDLETKLKTSLTASAVAHEINQPLSAILLQSKMALQEGSEEGQALRLIAEEAQRVVATIDKMKTLLRNVQTEPRPIDLAEVVKSALLYNKGLLARHRILLRQSGLDRACPLRGDDAQLQLAVTNLVRNAVEAIEEAKPKKREILVELHTHGGAAELIIGDSGPGWPVAGPAETPLTTTKKSGTGIGLYVVRTALQNHRGEVAFARSPLGGAEVRLKFPKTEKILATAES